MGLAQRLARPLLASSIIASGLSQLRDPQPASNSLEPALNKLSQYTPQASIITGNPALVARVLGGAQAGAGVLLALGKLPRAAALLLGATQTVNAVAEFVGTKPDSDGTKKLRNKNLLKNASVIGGVIYASVDRGGKPSLAWRAEHLVKDTQKQATKALVNLKK